jgi:hypothetical protein
LPSPARARSGRRERAPPGRARGRVVRGSRRAPSPRSQAGKRGWAALLAQLLADCVVVGRWPVWVAARRRRNLRVRVGAARRRPQESGPCRS